MKPEFYIPVKPWRLNQPWGRFDPKTYAQFGFSRHNGIDVALATDKRVLAPFDGIIIRSDNQPNGGGIFIGLLSKNFYDFPSFVCKTPEGNKINFPAMRCQVLFDFLHLEKPMVKLGQEVKAGDLIAIADNTGFSTGPHTHIQPRRVEYDGKNVFELDQNEANNSFDPDQFWVIYAEDFKAAQEVVKESEAIIQNIETLPDITPSKGVLDVLGSILTKLLEFLKVKK